MKNFKQMWWKVRHKLARWWPDPVEGFGLSPHAEMSSGELRLDLNVEGREGTVFLSKEMWLCIGALAGWCSQKEADDAWDAATRDAELTPDEYLTALAEIEAWRSASGLVDKHGDPDGITPKIAQSYWEKIEREHDRYRDELKEAKAVIYRIRHIARDAYTDQYPDSAEQIMRVVDEYGATRGLVDDNPNPKENNE